MIKQGNREVNINEAESSTMDLILGTVQAIINAWNYSVDYVEFKYDTGEVYLEFITRNFLNYGFS